MRQWIINQLAYLNELEAQPEFSHNQFDDVRAIIREAGRRAALAGLPAAVAACEVRGGGLSPSAARRILAACLAAMPAKRAARLTPPEVAKRYGVSADTVRKWIEDGELAAVNVADPLAKRPRLRIEPDSLTTFDKRRAAKTEKPSPPKRRRKPEPKLLVTRFST